MQMHGYDHSLEASSNSVSVSGANNEAETASTVVKQKKILAPATNKNTRQDVIIITIPINGDKEYKFLMAKGAALEYDWKTDGEALFFDFHGEPTGDKTGYFKSFEKQTASASSGKLVTEFAGTHGWYWQNKSLDPVVITLKVKGDYQKHMEQ